MPSELRVDAPDAAATAQWPAGGGGNNQPDADEWDRLRRANDDLRARVDDLTSALLARDLEIAGLRERCQLLTAAVEQQDEVLAKIYAAAAAGPPLTLPVAPAGKAAAPTAQKKPGIASTLASAVAILEPAREMLESHLDSVGFQCGRVVEVLESLSEGMPTRPQEPPSDVVSVALDKLLDRSHPTAKPRLFGGDSDHHSSSSSASSSPLSSSSGRSARKSSRPSLGRQDSTPSEEDFAKSAGFLKRPNRKSSVRLSVSDFGLLGDDDDNTNNQQDGHDGANQTEGARAATSTIDGSNESALKKKQQLFAAIDAIDAKRKIKAKKSTTVWGSEDEQEDELSYGEFLERISMPASRDILDKIRKFVRSILGPRGDGRPPRASDYADYEFYGRHEFRRRCERFFHNMDVTLQNHPAWRNVSESKLLKARDGIEKYVMDKVYDVAFNQLGECLQWKKEDEKLLQRMQLLSFISPDMLDIKPCMRNEVVWSMAEDELRRMNSFRAPGDKINCIVRCCSVIFSVLNLSRGDSGSRPGADDFLPVFIYIVLHSQIPRLFSTCEYIAAYRNPADLMSKAGYCFVNLRSAIEFISVIDGSMLSIPNEEFDRLYSEREKQLKF